MAGLVSEMRRIGMELYPTPPGGLPSGTFSGLVEALGGQREAAKLITVGRGEKAHTGVTQRAMERYAAAERGETTRGQPRPEGLRQAQAQLLSAWQEKHWDKQLKVPRWHARGMHVDWRGDFSTPSEPEKGRHIQVTIPPDEVHAITELWRQHAWTRAAQRFNYAVFDAYGLNGGVLNRYGAVEEVGFWLEETDSLSLT